jgi:hypothetical protein
MAFACSPELGGLASWSFTVYYTVLELYRLSRAIFESGNGKPLPIFGSFFSGNCTGCGYDRFLILYGRCAVYRHCRVPVQWAVAVGSAKRAKTPGTGIGRWEGLFRAACGRSYSRPMGLCVRYGRLHLHYHHTVQYYTFSFYTIGKN